MLWEARSVGARMRGLLGRRELPEGEGILLLRCNSVHTFFMRFTIDVIYLDVEWRVCRIARNLKPFRMSWGGPARRAIEVQSGWLDSVSVGDTIQCR